MLFQPVKPVALPLLIAPMLQMSGTGLAAAAEGMTLEVIGAVRMAEPEAVRRMRAEHRPAGAQAARERPAQGATGAR